EGAAQASRGRAEGGGDPRARRRCRTADRRAPPGAWARVILGLVEHESGELDELSLELLTFGRLLAERLKVPLHAVLVGKEAQPLASRPSAFGASTVHLVEHPRLGEYAPEAWAESLVQLMAALEPQVVLAAGGDPGNEGVGPL